MGLVGQVVLVFFFCYCHIRSARLDFWLCWNKSREKMLTESGGAQRVMQNENLKYFIIPLVTHKCVRVMGCWVRVERYDNLWLFYKHHSGVSSGGAARGYLLGRSRLAFFPVKQSMNRIDMLFSINDLLILKDLIPFIHLRVTTIKCKLITAMMLINNFRREVR